MNTKIFTICILMFFSISLIGQIDTLKVYDGLSISYMIKKDTVLISYNKLNSIADILRFQNQEAKKYKDLSEKYEININAANNQIAEYQTLSERLQERADLYEGSYNQTTQRIQEMNDLWQTCITMNSTERKKGMINGILYGSVGGVLVGIITAAIILK